MVKEAVSFAKGNYPHSPLLQSILRYNTQILANEMINAGKKNGLLYHLTSYSAFSRRWGYQIATLSGN
uniref:Uncharacterized protein n=1 Tax=Yersinia ruckeri TaxID=29486 RepID=A0A0A8VM45_YERRU|nr:hypothetical protein CSF007_14685 [Yersinia ruckeri]